MELTSDIGSLKRLADKKILKPAGQQHIAGVESSAPQCIDCFKTFCIGKAFIGSKRCAMLAFSSVATFYSVSAGMCTVAQGMQSPPSMLTPNESLLNAADEALDMTSPCNITL